jgi:ParB-like chromosome segregation protein Spo0J
MLAGRKFIREFDPADARPVPTSTLMQFAATRPPLSSAERPYLDELKADIAKNGIKRPVLVIGDKLADGLHRVTVANELGLETVPTVIKTTAEFHAAVGATP